ncbi:death domain-associated protein 6 isoform X2 [Orussus abietinus]|nr:death domain-associated protein 6 isoform X2 [Orussus abietinus]
MTNHMAKKKIKLICLIENKPQDSKRNSPSTGNALDVSIPQGVVKNRISFNSVTEEKQSENGNENSKSSVNTTDTSMPQDATKKENDEVNITVEEFVEKPKLVVKEKVDVYHVDDDTFPMFLNLCLQRDSSKEMEKIVSKLKKRYIQLAPAFANSSTFKNLLNEKREAILSNDKQIYVHIVDVMNVMKEKQNKDEASVTTRVENDKCNEILKPSTSEIPKDHPPKEPENNRKQHKIEKYLKKLEYAMERCERRIKKLEEAEVDFDDDNDSNYIKTERYKQRMVELYTKWCELSGESADAGRTYLRPKSIKVSPIDCLNQAICSFVNSKISRRNKSTKNISSASAVIFPDYGDILTCLKKCNDEKQLGLTKKRQEAIAKDAFTRIGEYLQHVRRADYWDTFSLYLEKEDNDPAKKSRDLSEKLQKNQEEGKKKLAEVFETYAKKQETGGLELNDSSELTDKESDQEEDESEGDQNHSSEENTRGDALSTVESDTESVDERVTKSNEIESATQSIQEAEKDVIVKSPEKCGKVSSIMPETATVPPLTPFETISTCKDNVPEIVSVHSVNSTQEIKKDEMPVLRVRAFAKPPGSWKDSPESAVKPKLISPSKEETTAIVDLTKDSPKLPTGRVPIKTIRLDSKTFAAFNGGKTILIPAKKSHVISIQNVTKNYVVKQSRYYPSSFLHPSN